MICATRQTQEEVVLINYNEYCQLFIPTIKRKVIIKFKTS